MLNVYGNQMDYLSILSFIVRTLLHIGIIASVWRFRQENTRWRPGVGILATLYCGVHAWIVFTAFVDLKSKGFDMFNPAITFCVFCLYMYTLALKGNVAPMARPIINVYQYAKVCFYAKR